MDTFQDLLDTVRGVGLAVEFPGDDVLEQFSAGDSVSVSFHVSRLARLDANNGVSDNKKSSERKLEGAK